MTILDRIVETKRAEVAEAQKRRPLEVVRTAAAAAEPPRDFFGAVTAPSPRGVRLIAEIKKSSPSAGVIVQDFNPAELARSHASCGAAALSVLTDETYFQGDLRFISLAKESAPLPVLRKDFIINAYQVYEARAAGADAVLLIAEVLKCDLAARLASLTRELGMTALIEVHSSERLQAIMEAAGPPGPDSYILGINNRDLAAQRIVPETVTRLARLVPAGAPFISESGIRAREDVLRAEQAGACAILVGESLLRGDGLQAAVNALLGVT